MFQSIEKVLHGIILEYAAVHHIPINEIEIVVKRTDENNEGDITLLVFPFTKHIKQPVERIANDIGTYCLRHPSQCMEGFKAIKGFLNFTVREQYWLDFVANQYQQMFWTTTSKQTKVVVEFSSPNTNKPLHLGHLRNNFLGTSVARLLQSVGYDVHKSCVVNDRGVHICKSMIAWQKFANGATPQSTQMKGDHFVGDYYVAFEKALKEQVNSLKTQLEQGDFSALSDIEPIKKVYAQCIAESHPEKREKLHDALLELLRNATPLMQEVRQMLIKWEQNDPEVIQLWKTMNDWVYEGFQVTYDLIGTSFDDVDYESHTYLLGKEIVQQGLKKGAFYQKEDGSIWADLTDYTLDHKLLLRKDQTSVYITQDLGLIAQRFERLHFKKSIYVVGNEQDYHFRVLQALARKMNAPYKDAIFHLSYGMVELPTGKMKSREGTVVDADDLIAEVIQSATKVAEDSKKLEDVDEQSKKQLHKQVGLAALKFYLLRVNPVKKMMFDTEESIDIHGFTGPFIQYTHARIVSVLKQMTEEINHTHILAYRELSESEKKLILHLENFPSVLVLAAENLDPSEVANYVFHLAKKFNSFYAQHAIAKADTLAQRHFRAALALMTQRVIQNSLTILGIESPTRM